MVEADDEEDGGDNLLGILQGDDSKEEEEDEQKRGVYAEEKSEVVEEQGGVDEQHQTTTREHQLRSIGGAVVTRQLPRRGLSFQLWPAASTLVSLLDSNPSLLLPDPLPSLPGSLRVLEVGSGTGLVGIAAAAVLGARVAITDLPHVLPNLQFNAGVNAGLVARRGGEVVARRLRWGEEEDAAELVREWGGFDLVVASDVVYYEELVEPLLRTLRWAVRGEAAFVMGHLRRWKRTDSAFFRKARKVFDVRTLHTDPPLPGARVGVAVYHFVEKKGSSNNSFNSLCNTDI